MAEESYTVVLYVVEQSVRGGPWQTWPEPLREDETKGQEAFLRAHKRRTSDHDASRMRLIKRTAVITDEVLAEEDPKGGPGIIVRQGDWTQTL